MGWQKEREWERKEVAKRRGEMVSLPYLPQPACDLEQITPKGTWRSTENWLPTPGLGL